MKTQRNLTNEEKKVYAQIESRDLRELEKCLVKTHQAWLIMRKRAEKYNLTQHERNLSWAIRKLLYELYGHGVLVVFVKHAGILKDLGYTGEELLKEWELLGDDHKDTAGSEFGLGIGVCPKCGAKMDMDRENQRAKCPKCSHFEDYGEHPKSR